MSSSNQVKAALLGMPFGTAQARLRKSIMFDLAKQCGRCACYRCGEQIDDIATFSIEHKTAWESSADPIDAFYQLGNIAFSHYICNVRAASRPNKKYANVQERKKAEFSRYYEKHGAEWNKRRNYRRRKDNRVKLVQEESRPWKPDAGGQNTAP